MANTEKAYLFRRSGGGGEVHSGKRMYHFWNIEEKIPMEHSNGDVSLEVLGKELRFTSH